MALELNDGKITGSSGVAKAGLTLGIIGTGLAVLGGAANNGFGWGNGWGNGFFGWGGNNAASLAASNAFQYQTARSNAEAAEISALESQIARLQSGRYTDYVGLDLYKEIISQSKEEDEKIRNNQEVAFKYIIDLDKRTALNEQASRLNREYDNASRDFMFTILNNKIDCCCDKTNMQICFNQQLNQLADASIISYTNSNFIPGTLKLPASTICPPVQLA